MFSSLLGIFSTPCHVYCLFALSICVELISEMAIVVIHKLIFKSLCLLSPHIEVLHGKLLLLTFILLHLQSLIPLRTSNLSLKVCISHVVYGISFVHVGQLLLIPISNCANCCASFLFASRLLIFFKLFPVFHKFKISLSKNLLLSLLDHVFLVCHCLGKLIVVVYKCFVCCWLVISHISNSAVLLVY